MHAEVMAIGDELTSGQRLDTNSQWLSLRLGELGVPVAFHTTVGDDLPALVAAVGIALRRAPLIVITGGLGPTADDLTRQAIATATERPLELRPEVLQVIESRFANRGLPMPPQNRLQAMFPHGSRVIPNPHGTAPGIDLTWSGQGSASRLFAVPGVPAEMIEMWLQTVRTQIETLIGSRQLLYHHRVKCFGVGESQLESMLPDMINRQRDPRVGITVHQATITLRITASGPDEEFCRRHMQPTLAAIHAALGDLVFGQEDEELEDVVLRLLTEHDQRLVVCEWGTAGLLAQWLAAADTSARLHAALVVTDLGALKQLFQSPPPMADPTQLLHWMAESSRRRFQSDWALAVGPIPDPRDDDPHLLIGLAGPQGTVVVQRSFRGHPEVLLPRAAKQALDLLRRELMTSGPR
jgi:nicotinamide-nucleotide amidase